MSRKDYFNDPAAPIPTRIVPAVTAFVQDERGFLLLERRSDNGRWGMPGGVQEIGEDISHTVVREVAEETGITVEVTGLVGIFTDPGHVIEFSNGEVRQEFSLCFRARPVAGEVAVSAESFEVRWVDPAELASLDISPTTQRRITAGLKGLAHPVIR
ncbi:NUDIX domain-containing protein [Streptomyces sp. ME02-6987-2C]|uniref:NUDIX domain-containing protein n=1 Tax=unclassified Streptomyces TaxID=2593676 RepID=UPI0029A2B1A5|nr:MULTISPECIES: NUDIX domain-containing protein [unclassified Streptomyces]MDX3365469.1 NUDIX domain-containing protein [Streptomyces sp. ME02-6987-2C]MDX3422625.1 NUDIX domain-containing protein [Streptomyces sp. ME02-6985-2c]